MKLGWAFVRQRLFMRSRRLRETDQEQCRDMKVSHIRCSVDPIDCGCLCVVFNYVSQPLEPLRQYDSWLRGGVYLQRVIWHQQGVA